MRRRGLRTVAVCLAMGGGVAVLPVLPASPASAGVAVERVSGADRYSTGISVARRGWPNGASAVVLVGGRDHRDALAASGLAGLAGHAPILLTPPDALRDDVAAELTRLAPSKVYLVGGEVALSTAVEDAVRAIVPDVTRYAGADAAGTAAAVAAGAFAGGLPASAQGSVLLVNAGDAAAGVAAGGLAAARGIPLLLTGNGTVPAETQAALSQLAPSAIYGIGAAAADVPGMRRIAGADVFATGVSVAELAIQFGINVGHAVLASQWSDGVVAAALAGALNAPMLLTDPVVWHGRLDDWFRWMKPAGATVVGGEYAIDPMLLAVVAEGGGSSGRGPGSSGPVVSAIQQRMIEIGFAPSAAGQFDFQTQVATWALQKAFGLPLTGAIGAPELGVLYARQRPPVLRPDITTAYGDHVEVSLTKQLVQVVRNGAVLLSVHTSTGKPSTPTIRGLFRILSHRPGFNAEGMYMSMYFSGGYAIHGYDPVPTYPASHGCARVIYRNAELLYSVVPNGMPVIVW